MKQRQRSGHCQFIRGKYDDFRKEFISTEKQFIGTVVIVQPSLSKSKKMPDKIQEVLAAASNYVKNSGRVRKLRIMGSK